MAKDVCVIWLDNSIDENNEQCQQLITQLRSVFNDVNTFTDTDKCIDFLTNVYNEKTFMIISEALCEIIMHLIHDVAQLHTVVVFCESKAKQEQWARKWSKIKGIFTQMPSVCNVLEKAAQQYEQNATSISFINTHNDVSKKNLHELDPSFMYTQILKEILLDIEFEEKHIKEFIDYCRNFFVDNEGELANVNKLGQMYHNKTPIGWYTGERFLYSMLNSALRLMDVNVIINMGFFIRDLHRHIEQLHSEQFPHNQSDQSFTLYRGQGVSESDFDQLMQTMDGLMSFNNFLSTTKDRAVSFAYAESNASNPDYVGILFVMKIDPSKSTTPFASINDFSRFIDEDEVLFSMHTVFRICDIKQVNENKRLFQVNLTLTNDKDNDLYVLTNRIREEIFPDSVGWYKLAMLLLKMGQPQKAQELYEVMLGQINNDNEKGPIYHQIGWTMQNQGKYKDAIRFGEKALEILQKTIPTDYIALAMCYNSIGNVYNYVGERSKALSYYEETLVIRKKVLPSSHLDLAMSYNNIGTLYCQMEEYITALPYFEQALVIRQKNLPPNHPSLVTCFVNIGHVYGGIEEYSKALSYYEKALHIAQKILPSNHPDLATCYDTIGSSHAYMCEYSKALSYFDKALKIREKSLSRNHPDLLGTYINIGGIYYSMREYSKALSFFEKAFDIEEQPFSGTRVQLAGFFNNIAMVYDKTGDYTKELLYLEKALKIWQEILPSNHSNLATVYNNIGNAYDNMDEYSKALEYYEKALQIFLEILPSNHCTLATPYNNIGLMYFKMHNHPKAVLYYNRALQICQKTFPENHPELVIPYHNIGEMYYTMGEYSKAVSYYEKALVIEQQTLSPNHPNLAALYNNIGGMYCKMDEYSKALPLLERALGILQQSLPSDHPTLLSCRNNLNLVKYNL